MAFVENIKVRGGGMADEAGPSGASTALVEAPEGHAGSGIRPTLQCGNPSLRMLAQIR
jgi:hypothetical protein